MDFYTSCTSGNQNEQSKEELQNLQLYSNCVSTLPDKTKNHIKIKNILKSIVTVFYYSTARMSL